MGVKKVQTRAKDVLSNIHRTQGPECQVQKSKIKVTAACSRRDHSVAAGGDGSVETRFLCLLILAFDF